MTSAFLRATEIQARVIGALILRELVVEGSTGVLPFFSYVIRPIIMVTGFLIIGQLTSPYRNGFPTTIFVITGYLSWFAFFRSFGQTRAKGGGVLMIPHVTTLDLILGKIGVEFCFFTAIFVVFSGVAMLFGGMTFPADPLGVILAFWSAMGLGISLGLIAASVSRFTTLLDDLWIGIRLLGHAISGVFVLATSTPQSFLDFLRWNPLFHSVEWIREAWWPAYQSPIANPLYAYSCVYFMLAIGLAFERASRRWENA